MNDFIQDTNWVKTAHPILQDDKVFVNDVYQVNLKEIDDGIIHLSIKRKDKVAVHDWRDLQLIKNKLCGEEREAVEIYPAESRLVDSSNQYHLWVYPEGYKIPFGYVGRLIVDKQEGGFQKAGQREFKDDETPSDIISQKKAEEIIKVHYPHYPTK